VHPVSGRLADARCQSHPCRYEPREIAGAALFLASDAASFVNSQVIAVDGGMTVQM